MEKHTGNQTDEGEPRSFLSNDFHNGDVATQGVKGVSAFPHVADQDGWSGLVDVLGFRRHVWHNNVFVFSPNVVQNRGNNLERRVHVDGGFLEMMWYGVGRVDLVLVNEVTNVFCSARRGLKVSFPGSLKTLIGPL